MKVHRSLVAFALVAGLLVASGAQAQIAVSANDNKVMLDNGVVKVLPNPAPDTVSIIDLRSSPPRVIAEVPAPVSVAGPPLSVAITPDESLALVTASNKIDPADRTKQTPNNQVSVIDLKASPPRVIATLEAGKGAAGVSINRQGSLALVSNMVDGTVSIFTIQGKTVTPAGTLEVGGLKIVPADRTKQTPNNQVSVIDLKASPPRVIATLEAGKGAAGVSINRQGSLALVSNMVDGTVSIFTIQGKTVTPAGTLEVGGP